MIFNGILLDLDDTLYDYTHTHRYALEESFKLFGIDIALYDKYSIETHINLNGSAASHNKYITFKKIMTYLGRNNELNRLNETYWQIFFENMILHEGVKEFIIFCKQHKMKICLITDFICEYQIKKLEKLRIYDLIDLVITSEEVGSEKPDSKIFLYALHKLNLSTRDVCMIGDSYHKDIVGATNLGIYTFHFNREKINIVKKDGSVFNSFIWLLNYFQNIYTQLKYMINLSKYVGERFDLTQAGGGNISFKSDDLMFIKSSGIALSDITFNSGYSVLYNKDYVAQIKQMDIDVHKKDNEVLVKKITNQNMICGNKTSIETPMHSFLKRWTLHLHPIQVNILTSDMIKELFPDSLLIDYYTPGIELSLNILQKYNGENIIFLINHGIIITHESVAEIYFILDTVLEVIEKYLNITEEYEKYHNVNKISSLIENSVTYLCDSIDVKVEDSTDIVEIVPLTPDIFVYCGYGMLIINSKMDCHKQIQKYKNQYNDVPKIVIYDGYMYIVSMTLKKCMEIEQVLKSYLCLIEARKGLTCLSKGELEYLNNWDAEKYRKTI